MPKANFLWLPAILVLSSCGIGDGPDDRTVEEIAKRALTKVGAADASDWPEIAKKGNFQNKGCKINPEVPGVYVCVVDTEFDLPGYGKKEQELPVAIVKKADGDWVSIDECRENIDSAKDC